MSWKFTNYPEIWNEMKEAIFYAYGGKYCVKTIFKKYFHKGYIQVHHWVPLSKAENLSEYYFLNQPWNLVPLCEKHHNQYHKHMNEIHGVYRMQERPKKNKVSYLRRLGWHIKRRSYKKKFEKRKKGEKVISFWSSPIGPKYTEGGKKRLRKKMYEWPKKFLEDLV